VGRQGLRRVHDRRLLAPEPELPGRHHEAHLAGARRPGARPVDPAGTAWRAGASHRRGLAQYASSAFTNRLAAAGVSASVGTVGGDNALAESVIGLYETELIKLAGPWRTAEQQVVNGRLLRRQHVALKFTLCHR
jgi:transposase InsO family protein